MNQKMRINKKIAEICGWVQLKKFSVDRDMRKPYEFFAGYHPIYHSPLQFNYETPIPNYVGDLNAMHEAERLLDGFTMAEYSYNLMLILKTGCGSYLHIHAPANARAEAFLKTMQKFRQSKR